MEIKRTRKPGVPVGTKCRCKPHPACGFNVDGGKQFAVLRKPW